MARKRHGSVRSGSQRIAEEIVESARAVRDDPEHAVPECKGSCPLFCYFKRARKAVDRRQGMIGDEDKLERWSNWGNKLGRAYAVALRIAEQGADALEFFQNVRTHAGEVPVAPWGNAPVFAHVGMQHHLDRGLRLLKAVPFIDEGEVVYATENGLVCAHDEEPPEETVDLLVDGLPVERASPTLARCPHVHDEFTDGTYIEISWPSAELCIQVCEGCSPGNLLGRMQNVMVTPDPLDIVAVDVSLPRLRNPSGGTAPQVEVSLPRSVLQAYVNGEQDDEGLIEEAHRARYYELRQRPEPLVVHGKIVHEPPFERFVDELDPPEPQRSLVEAALARLERPIVLRRGTPVEVLEEVWDTLGEEVLVEVLGAEGRELYDPRADAGEIEQLLDQVRKERARQRVEEELPHYEHVPEPVDLADETARRLIGEGRDSVQQLLSSAPDPDKRAVGLALVEALDLPSRTWTVDGRTEDQADHLVPYVEELLEARGEAYHEALEQLLRATGSTEDLERASG
jgi:hypothetical protein